MWHARIKNKFFYVPTCAVYAVEKCFEVNRARVRKMIIKQNSKIYALNAILPHSEMRKKLSIYIKNSYIFAECLFRTAKMQRNTAHLLRKTIKEILLCIYISMFYYDFTCAKHPQRAPAVYSF